MSEIEIKNTKDKKLRREYEITVPIGVLEKKIANTAEKHREKYKADGFRPGKVPLDIIINKHKMSLLMEASEEIVNETSQKIVDENDFRLALSPKVEVMDLAEDKDLKFNITIDLYPEIPEIKYDKITVKAEKIKISEKDIEDTVNKVVKSRAKWAKQPEEHKAKIGDAVLIDYLGRVDGVAFDGGKGEDYQLELGSKTFIEGFEDQLVGSKAGDEITVKVRFPKVYHSADLADKKAEFEVKVKSILKSEIPELTDEYVKENLGADSLDKLREMIKNQLSDMYTKQADENLKSNLFDALAEHVKFDLPEGLVEAQFKRMWENLEKKNPKKFKDDKEKEKAKDDCKEAAEKSTKIGLLLSDLAKQNKIEATPQEVNDEIFKRASAYPGSEQFLVDYYQKNPEMLDSLVGTVLENKVFDLVKGKINIRDNEISIEDFMKEEEKRFKKSRNLL